jgi:hypothetical protein
MPRALCLLLCFSSFAVCQNFNRKSDHLSSPSSSVEVFYVVDGSTLTTYNVDQQTFEATAAGTTAMPSGQYPGIVTSPNGQFLYYVTGSSYSGQSKKLYVYDTDTNGVPGNAPVQSMNAGHLSSPVVNPNGAFFYTVNMGTENPDGTSQFAIVRSTVDPSTGKLSQPVTEATYTLDTEASGNDCELTINGFNPAGTIMYDAIVCDGPHASGSSTYNQRTVNLQTGALGADQQIYGFGYYAGSGNANVQFENNFMFSFVYVGNQGPDANEVDVYQLPNTATPVVSCTTSMLAVCGDFGFGLAHPSGEYVFMQGNGGLTYIGQVNVDTQQIVEVNSLPYGVWMFSPDGKVVYGLPSMGSQHDIYLSGFNATTGDVKLGGVIQLPHVVDYWVAAERY